MANRSVPFTPADTRRDQYTRGTRTTHGLSRTPEHQAWIGMRQRCLNPHGPAYHHYGGRGITVCRRWRHFVNFLADMGPRPSRKHSLERTNNAKGYNPANCVWALQRQQCNNTRRCVYIKVFGKRMTLTQAAAIMAPTASMRSSCGSRAEASCEIVQPLDKGREVVGILHDFFFFETRFRFFSRVGSTIRPVRGSHPPIRFSVTFIGLEPDAKYLPVTASYLGPYHTVDSICTDP